MVTEVVEIVIRERGSRATSRGLFRVGRTARAASSGVSRLQAALLALGAALSVRALVRTADEFTLLSRAIQQSTKETGDAIAVQNELLAISNRTGTGLADNAALFQRLSVATRNLGASNRDVLGVLEGLNAALLLSGTSAAEARGGLIQLGQGLASGRLAGDELRSVLEALPSLAQALAAELGTELGDDIEVTVGRLRELGAEGRLTGDVVFPALQRAVAGFTAELGNIQFTTGEAVNVLRNNFLAVIGEINTEIGGTSGLNEIILEVAQNIRGILLTSTASIIDGLVLMANAILALIQTFSRLRGGFRSVIGTYLEFNRVSAEASAAVARFQNTLFLLSDETLAAVEQRAVDAGRAVDNYATATFEAEQETADLLATLDGFADRVGALGRVADRIRAIRDAGPGGAVNGQGAPVVSTAPRGGGGPAGPSREELDRQADALEKLRDLQIELNRAAAAERGERELAIFDLRQQIQEARTLAEIAGQDPAGNLVVQQLEAQLADLQRRTDFGEQLGASLTGAFEGAFQSAIENGANFTESLATALEENANQALTRGFASSFDSLQEGLTAVFDNVANSLDGVFGESFQGLGSAFSDALSGALQFVAQQGLAALLGGGGNAQSSSSNAINSSINSSQAIRGIVAGPTQIGIAQVGESISDAFRPIEDLANIRNAILIQIRDRLSGGSDTTAPNNLSALETLANVSPGG